MNGKFELAAIIAGYVLLVAAGYYYITAVTIIFGAK